MLMVLLVVILLPAAVHAQSGIEPSEIERTGQSGWQFLKINEIPDRQPWAEAT